MIINIFVVALQTKPITCMILSTLKKLVSRHLVVKLSSYRAVYDAVTFSEVAFSQG